MDDKDYIPPIRGLNRSFITSDEMVNKNYTVIARQYMFGQIRLHLTDVRKIDQFAPEGHGGIVRELDTYKTEVAAKTMLDLSEAEDPEKYCIGLERDWNCEFSGDGPLAGDRIRLDETPESNPYRRCKKQAFRLGAPQAYPIVNTKGLFA
jgi:hypothetical protein